MTNDAGRPPPDQARSRILLRWLGLVSLVSAVFYAITYVPLGTSTAPPSIALRLVTYPALFILYFFATFVVWRQRDWTSTSSLTAIVFVAAVIFRAITLSGPVAKNNDNRRYLWEGRVVLAGMNPYAAPPASPVYDALRGELRKDGDTLFEELTPSLNNVRSVYGPIATAIFVVPHWLPFDRIWALRLLMTLFDLGTVLVLMGLLRSVARAPALALVYAWNPVCVNAFSDRAQIDAAMVFFLALATWLVCLGRSGWAGWLFGAALLVKISPLYLAFPMIRMGRLRFLAALAVAGLLGLIPFILAGKGAFSGFQIFGAQWHNIDSIHALILLGLQPLGNLVNAHALARVIVLIGALVYAIWRTFCSEKAGVQWLFETCAAIAGASLLLSPVVHPWYTTHMLIFLCLAPNPGLLLLTCATMSWFLRFWKPPANSLGATMLDYVKEYREPWRWVAYPPVFALLIVAWLRRRLATSRGDA